MEKRFPYIGPEADQIRPFEVYSIRDNDKLVAREVFVKPNKDSEVLQEKINEIRNLFQNFEKETGIRVVRTDYVIAEDTERGLKKIDAFSEKIDGENLDSMLEITDAQAPAVIELIERLWEYFKNGYNKKSILLSDIFRSFQYLLGKRPGETEDHIYLVDIDPLTESNYEPKNLHSYRDMLNDFLVFCSQMEKKNGNINLTSLKEQIKAVDNKIRNEHVWTEI